MRRVLEFTRAVIALSAVPAGIVFMATTSRSWYIALFVYVVFATIALLILNRVLDGRLKDETKAPPRQTPK